MKIFQRLEHSKSGQMSFVMKASEPKIGFVPHVDALVEYRHADAWTGDRLPVRRFLPSAKQFHSTPFQTFRE
jgi:hypothetical protein